MTVAKVKTFEEVWPTIPANGWLSEVEGRLLWDEAVRENEEWSVMTVLEVGCFQGRSTCLLAAVAPDVVVLCVDPWLDDPTEPPNSGNRTYAAFMANINSRELDNVFISRRRVEDWPERMTKDAAGRVYPRVGLAYLDGDHAAEGTRVQIKTAQLCGANVIAIHDVNDSGEGVAVRDVALEMLGPWDVRIERLAVWRIK